MTTTESPLKKYQRQPKLYIDLPSKGQWYRPGSLVKAENVAVYSMTAGDEILVKTPDALFSGQTTVNIIQNCVPDIKNAWDVPIVDLYTILSAIRIASYGPNLEVTSTCPSCKEENTYGIGLQPMIDQFANVEYIDHVNHEGFDITLAPLSYKEVNDVNKAVYVVQRRLVQQIPDITDENEKDELTQRCYDRLVEINTGNVLQNIAKVTTPDGDEETNQKAIIDFVKSAEKEFYTSIQNAVIQNNRSFEVPKSKIQCASCNHETETAMDLDYSNFFVRYL